MKFKKFIEEEYLGFTIEWNDKETDVEVFKNPSKKEIKECGKNIRFIVDFEKENLYIARAEDCIHNDIVRSIKKNDKPNENLYRYDVNDYNFWKYYFAGFAKSNYGKLDLTYHAEGMGDYFYENMERLKKYDDSWLNQWFVTKNPIKNFNNIDEEYLGLMKGSFWNTKTSSIFKNPSKKEIKECGTEIRFIVDFKKKNLFVWDGGILIHKEVAKFLYNEGELSSSSMDRMSFWKWYYAGIAKLAMGKLRFFRHSDWLENKEFYEDINIDNAEWPNEDDSWTKQWFTEPLLKSIHEYGY